jgi:tRNA threonylcarbamoyladenosine biosynthesis protein TsaB
MNLLAIETSSHVLSVAIKKSGAKLRHATVRGYMKHAENLLPVIDRLLKNERLKIGDIDAFLIGRGPGSFTGLRIGFATLKGFLATCPKPCYGAFSLDVIATGIKVPGIFIRKRCLAPLNLTVCLDARRGKLYARSYRYLKGGWVPCGPCRVALPEELSGKLPAGSRVAGDGIAKVAPGGLTAMPEKYGTPQAATLIKLFEKKNPLLKKLRRPKEFLPVYLRRSEPEEKLSEKKQRERA